MANGKYGNTSSDNVKTGGGQERLTIASGVAVGSDIECAVAIIQVPTGNTGEVRVCIGATATATTGIEVPEGKANIRIEVQNLNMLNFYSGSNGDVVDIVYLR